MTAPDRLRIVAGVIRDPKGRKGDPRRYLASWQKKLKHEDGAPVCVIARDDLQKLLDDLAFWQEIKTCA